jgi:hypothetical protein
MDDALLVGNKMSSSRLLSVVEDMKEMRHKECKESSSSLLPLPTETDKTESHGRGDGGVKKKMIAHKFYEKRRRTTKEKSEHRRRVQTQKEKEIERIAFKAIGMYVKRDRHSIENTVFNQGERPSSSPRKRRTRPNSDGRVSSLP